MGYYRLRQLSDTLNFELSSGGGRLDQASLKTRDLKTLIPQR